MKLIDTKEMCRRFGISRATLWAHVTKTPGFPQPVQFSRRKNGYVESEVDEWIQKLMDERDKRNAA